MDRENAVIAFFTDAFSFDLEGFQVHSVDENHLLEAEKVLLTVEPYVTYGIIPFTKSPNDDDLHTFIYVDRFLEATRDLNEQGFLNKLVYFKTRLLYRVALHTDPETTEECVDYLMDARRLIP